MNSTSTSSPNDSNDSSEPRDHVVGNIMPMHDHDVMTLCKDSSSSPSISMHGVVTGNQFDPFTVLSNRYDDNNKIGLESDLSLPPLESRSIEENNAESNNRVGVKSSGNDNHHFDSTCFNNTDQRFKVEDMLGLENHWQGENVRMGEWDLEGLMENISSFPFLDFQVS
ncbi:hypothetical protein D5086_002397 [Populus alba]